VAYIERRKNDGETFRKTLVAGGAQQLITKRAYQYRSKGITLKRQKAGVLVLNDVAEPSHRLASGNLKLTPIKGVNNGKDNDSIIKKSMYL
jgi:hypothetical protein